MKKIIILLVLWLAVLTVLATTALADPYICTQPAYYETTNNQSECDTWCENTCRMINIDAPDNCRPIGYHLENGTCVCHCNNWCEVYDGDCKSSCTGDWQEKGNDAGCVTPQKCCIECKSPRIVCNEECCPPDVTTCSSDPPYGCEESGGAPEFNIYGIIVALIIIAAVVFWLVKRKKK